MSDSDRALPHVALATFCERVMQDKADDVISVIRVYDTITIPATAKGQFAELTAVIGLRSGDARGTYKVEFFLHPPAGAAGGGLRKRLLRRSASAARPGDDLCRVRLLVGIHRPRARETSGRRFSRLGRDEARLHLWSDVETPACCI
jgi:hypothetical protein